MRKNSRNDRKNQEKKYDSPVSYYHIPENYVENQCIEMIGKIQRIGFFDMLCEKLEEILYFVVYYQDGREEQRYDRKN